LSSVADLDQKLEVVVIPVSDVDRATAFYKSLGWRQDVTPPGSGVVQLTPHGSDCCIQFGAKLTSAAPGSATGYLVVSDIVAARDELRGRGVEVSEVFHSDGVYAGTDEPYLFGRRRTSGPDPARGSYRSFASFRDPDGNGWLFQEVTTRLAGRIDSGVTSFASANDLADAFRRAEAAHGKYEARIGQGRDANWPEWYAAYMVAEQAGTELPS
jgi:catechol 2,3-dioxygenase-like lactoylglutathione lyase family enzyme